MFDSRNQVISTIAFTAFVALTCASAANAAFIDILSNHGVIYPASAPDTVINSTYGGGTVDMGDNTNREVHNLLDSYGLSGDPLEQSSTWADTTAAYWNSTNAGHNRGDVGVLIDLGGTYTLNAMHLFGYNIQDSGAGYSQRTPGAFSVWTSTDPSAVTTASGELLIAEVSGFTQHSQVVGMGDPGRNPTLGRTFLFGGADQPAGLGGSFYDVTPSIVNARYVFLGGLTPIWLNSSDLNIVGLGEVRFYGTPEPSTLLLGLMGLAGLGLIGRRRRKAA